MKKILFLLSFFLFLIPQISYAVTLDTAENILTTNNLLDDAYIISGNANIDHDVFGDLYVAGGSVIINGNVHEDLVVVGGRVTITGEVLGDLRVIGGQVACYGKVGDDVVAAGGQVDIGKTSVVGGSLLVGAGILTVDGEVKEDIKGGMGMLFLNGKVDGDVIVTIENTLTISNTALINGDLNYSSLVETNVPENVVKGKISFNKFEEESLLEDLTYIFFVQKIFGFLSALLMVALLVIFAQNSIIKAALITKNNVLKSFGVGLLTLITGFIGSIILFFTVIGIPLALIILVALFLIAYFSKIFVAVWGASYFLNFNKKISRGKLFLFIALLLFAYYLLGIIPFVGWIINIILFLIGFGTLILFKIEYLKFLKSKKML